MADFATADATFRQVNRSFVHRESETLNAISVMFQIRNLGLVHSALDPCSVVIMRQNFDDLALCAAIERFVMPERVVSIKSDYIIHKAGTTSSIRFLPTF